MVPNWYLRIVERRLAAGHWPKKLSIEIGGSAMFWWFSFKRWSGPKHPSPNGNSTWVPLWTLYLGPIEVRWLERIC